MANVSDVLEAIETIAPKRWALDFDHVGLQVGRPSHSVERGLVSLDWSEGLIAAAIDQDVQVIVCHHPLIWDPLTSIDESSRSGSFALQLIENRLAFIACHTNWDAAPGGVNDALADRLGLKEVSPFGSGAEPIQKKLVFFCPQESLQPILDAVEAIGAGTIGDYSRCAFVSEGTGTFRGSDKSQPFIGEPDRIEQVGEVRVEVLVPGGLEQKAVGALIANHPYEEPAYDLVHIEPEIEMPMGRLGEIESNIPFFQFQIEVDAQLETRSIGWGDPSKIVRRVAVCGGAADSMWREALSAGADVLVTGEVKQNVAVDASEAGLSIVAAGHYATEQPGMHALSECLLELVNGVGWSLFEPTPGYGGRPLM